MLTGSHPGLHRPSHCGCCALEKRVQNMASQKNKGMIVKYMACMYGRMIEMISQEEGRIFFEIDRCNFYIID